MLTPMDDLLTQPPPAVPLEQLAEVVRSAYGIAGAYTPLNGERDLNVGVATDEHRYVAKVPNIAEADAVLDLQIAALDHVAHTDPSLPIARVLRTLGGASSATISVDGRETRMWIMTEVNGDPLPPGPLADGTGRTIGEILARLQRALRGFFHPAAGRSLPWDARHSAELIPWAAAVDDPGLRRLSRRILGSTLDLASRLSGLPSQTIHHDFSRGNLLVDSNGGLCGIIDFGDMLHAARAQDLAVAATYAMLGDRDPIQALLPVVAGFAEVTGLEAAELDVVPELISIRLAQSLVIAAHRSRLHPENARYILVDTPAVATTLDQWSRVSKPQVVAALRSVAGLPRSPAIDLATRRRRSLWSGLRLTYDDPLHLVEGDGVWLTDASGRRYLDAYNNVPQVGHTHRRVTGAADAHARRLATNTRYLTDPVVDLAEALVALLPEPLEVCLFVNSGSEATDLALRIARGVTGRAGSIVTANAYHGWTDAVYAMSPEERPAAETPDWVATVAPPTVPGPGPVAALTRLRARGHRPAAWWFDGTFSSDGIRVPSQEYLDGAAATVREDGGLVVADEVQGGLGRIGRAYWAFRPGATVPDIVTLGKPLGNGYPIGAVVTTRDIADRFAERGYFFSTFGGNAVAAAAAIMVLRITDELDLAERAERVGSYLRAEMPAALTDLEVDVEIRGRGLFIGIDVATGALAHALVEGLRRERVLVGRTGPGGTVVKIRPPLVFDLEHADRLLEATAAAVRSLPNLRT
jgi:4-aminobutyrate aminotransferase-like enzyme/Ser/Thr protein kinase RdoA (MazF antagonist)